MIHHSLTRQKSISENYLGFIFHLETSTPDSPVKMLGEKYWIPPKWLKILTLDTSELYFMNIHHIQSIYMYVYTQAEIQKGLSHFWSKTTNAISWISINAWILYKKNQNEATLQDQCLLQKQKMAEENVVGTLGKKI